MKINLVIATAALLAGGAAFAQTTTAPSTAPGGTTDTMSAPTTADPSAVSDPMTSSAAPNGSMAADAGTALVKGPDGKWMAGDRPATKAEIAAYKKASKSKPM